MDGKQIAKIIDDVLSERGMTQKEFCAQLGIQSSAMSMWRKGSTPKPERLKQIEMCLGISFADYEKSDESDELREMLRDRQDLSISAKRNTQRNQRKPLKSLGFFMFLTVHNCSYLTAKVLSKCCQKWELLTTNFIQHFSMSSTNCRSCVKK